MDKGYFIEILKRYRSGTASKEEQRFIEAYYDLLELRECEEEQTGNVDEEMLYKIWERIRREEGGYRLRITKKAVRYRSVAAIVLILLVTAATVYLVNNYNVEKDTVARVSKPAPVEPVIKPAGKKAILTLANGKSVAIGCGSKDSFSNSGLGVSNVYKKGNGALVYEKPDHRAHQTEEYNMLATPRGGEFQIVLSDGTKVRLNAGSSLRYPVAFQGRERKVYLEGEAYFEVARKSDHPFIVSVGKSEVQVLGTHFNIKAYTEEPIRTTLAEGSIRVVKGKVSRLLRPGEQAVIRNEASVIDVRKVDVKAMMAWKNNLFYFNHSNIEDIMDELARWYDVEVIYKTNSLKKLNFSGVMSRYSDIGAILERLSLTGTIHFEVNGRTITVKN